MTKTVNIVIPFTFTYNDGKTQKFTAGEWELDDEVADHWYVQAHSANPPVVEPAAGTPEFAQLAAKRKQRRRTLELAAEEAADKSE